MNTLNEALAMAQFYYPDDLSLSECAARTAFMHGFCSATLTHAPNPWHESDPLAGAFVLGQDYMRVGSDLSKYHFRGRTTIVNKIALPEGYVAVKRSTLNEIIGHQQRGLQALVEISENRTEGK